MRLEARQERLPLAEESHAVAVEAVTRQRAEIAQAEQRLQVEQANRGHAQRSLQIIGGRRERLLLERQAMPIPDDVEFADKQEQVHGLRERIGELQEMPAGPATGSAAS
jgi:chromosome segregation protein